MNTDLMQKMAMLQQNQQQQGPESHLPQMPKHPMQHYNPISKGATEAMRSVRESIGMDPQQSRRALGAAVFNMFANRPVESPGSGLNGVLGSLSQGMTPAVEAYMKQQQQAEMMNYNIMKHNQELAHQQEVERRQMMELERRLSHDEAQERLMKNRFNQEMDYKNRYLEAMSERKSNIKPGKKAPLDEWEGIDLTGYPAIVTAKERNEQSKTYNGCAKALRALKEIDKSINELEKETSKESQVFSPTGSIVPGINKLKDWGAKAGIESLQKETVARQRMESQFKRLEPALESALKGSAAGEQMLKRFHEHKVYFSSDQPMNVIKDRTKELMDEISQAKDLAKLGLHAERQIDELPVKAAKAEESVDQDSVIDNYIQQYPELSKLPRSDVRQALVIKGVLK